MQEELKGHCKHGEFILSAGCPQCAMEWRRAMGILPQNDEMEDGLNSESLTLAVSEPQIVKVKYYSETTGEMSAREYTYYSKDRLSVGDIVTVPVRDTIGKAKVSTIDIPETEIANFKDKIKIIPSGSVISKRGETTGDGLPSVDLTTGASTPEVVQTVETPTAVINIGPEHNPTVLVLAEQARRLRDYAVARTIATDADLRPATDDLSVISKTKKALNEKKIDYLKPIKMHVDAVNAAFLSIMQPIEEADRITRTKITDYQALVRKHQLEAEEINRKKMELARQEAAFNSTGEITVDITPVDVPIPVNRVVTELGTTSTLHIRKYRVVDFAKLSDQYKIENSALLNKVVKAGIPEILGVEIYTEESIRVTAH